MAVDYDYTTSGEIFPIRNHIIVFDMDSEDEKVVRGIIIPHERGIDRGIHSRKARVYKIGPDQEDVNPGDLILVEHGRWTRGIKLNDGIVYRKVDPNGIFGVLDEETEI